MQESLVRRPDLSKWSAGLAYGQRLGCIAHLQELQELQEGRELHMECPVSYRAEIVMVATAMHDAP